MENYCRRNLGTAVALAGILLLVLAVTPSLPAQTFTLVHAFNPAVGDGAGPIAGLVRDAAGNYYGTTSIGGTSGNGTVYKIDTNRNETVLLSFDGADGSYPVGHVTLGPTGELYFTSDNGGAFGGGTVGEIDATGTATLLHSFGSGSDGSHPYSHLLRLATGSFYGTTAYGGTHLFGTVFRMNAAGADTILYNFTGGTDGSVPASGGLIQDASGNLYGTTYVGGAYGLGTVFELDASGTETVLHSFSGPPDGSYPYDELALDAAGNLYGVTISGGANGYGGVVFKVDSTGTETVLHSFGGAGDGSYLLGGLTLDAAGDLYGASVYGGTYGKGTVYKIDTSDTETILYNFTGGLDGWGPNDKLLLTPSGILYGTASMGGAYGGGTVFRLNP